jgi:hypothetical protein
MGPPISRSGVYPVHLTDAGLHLSSEAALHKYKFGKIPKSVTEIFPQNSTRLDFLSLNRLQRSTISLPESEALNNENRPWELSNGI